MPAIAGGLPPDPRAKRAGPAVTEAAGRAGRDKRSRFVVGIISCGAQMIFGIQLLTAH
jgi:hypothetical protein